MPLYAAVSLGFAVGLLLIHPALLIYRVPRPWPQAEVIAAGVLALPFLYWAREVESYLGWALIGFWFLVIAVGSFVQAYIKLLDRQKLLADRLSNSR